MSARGQQGASPWQPRWPLRLPLWSLGLLSAALSPLACEAPVTPSAPPSCEPRAELTVERQLKGGFKALAQEDTSTAAGIFRALLADEPGHPEAKLGLRLASGGHAVLRPRARACRAGALVVGGEEIAVDLPIDAGRYRFEERRAQWELARADALSWAPATIPRWYGPRPGVEGAALGAGARDRALDVIDLIVLYEEDVASARASFVRSGETGASSHFLIDRDGALYQTLDLARAAHRAPVEGIDGRSVAIGLVAGGRLRPPSTPARGYSEAQLRSLGRLLRALLVTLPHVPAQLPRARANAGGAVMVAPGPVAHPEVVVGVVGARHLVAGARDRGPDLDWEALAAVIGAKIR